MVELYAVVSALTLAHMVADYPLQTDWMAANKHSDTVALLTHSTVHGVVASVAVFWLLPAAGVVSVAILTTLFHATTDKRNLGIREDQTTHLVWCVVTAVIVLLL